MSRGAFFAIDATRWANVCELGMNPACAYLVLACFSGRDNRTTAASVHAVETYTQISRSRARAAIDALVSVGHVRRTRAKPLPRYDLPPAREGTEPDRIWLPNTLVTGAGAETPPVERVRQTRDAMTLRLLVDCYRAQNLREDGGITRSVWWQQYERRRVGERGEWVIWAFRNVSDYVRRHGFAEPHYLKLTADEKRTGVSEARDFFTRAGRLTGLGLIRCYAKFAKARKGIAHQR